MFAIAVAGLLLQGAPPTGQSFGFQANFDMTKNAVGLSAWRVVKTQPRRMNEVSRTYPFYKWSVPRVRLRFVPLSGQGTAPTISGIAQGLQGPPPPQTPSPDFGYSEPAFANAKVNWRGCKPGFYRMVAEADFVGQDRNWTMKFDHQEFYWRPMPPLPPSLRVGQSFLVVGSEYRGRPGTLAARLAPLYGKTISIQSIGKADRFMQTAVKFKLGKGGSYSTMFSEDRGDESLQPVFIDEESRQLGAKYIGKVTYPMGGYMALVKDRHTSGLTAYKRGEVSVVIRGIYRASKPVQLGHVDPYITGGYQPLLSGFYPLFVVFDVKSPKSLFEYEKLDQSKPVVVLVPDGWALERTFSLTSKKQDFANWKPKPNGFKEPTFVEPGFSPKRVAWVYEWPKSTDSLADTLRASEWRFKRDDQPDEVMRFNKGGFVKKTP